jgi:hypothetical protein
MSSTAPADRYTCCRCGSLNRYPLRRWPDGPICHHCVRKAVRNHGRCPGCGVVRALPGRSAQGAAICRDCAGIRRDFTCSRCGSEAALHTGHLCDRCALTERVGLLLDDGTGRVNPALAPLAAVLTSTPDPQATLMSLRPDRNTAKLLAELATGRIELSHEGLDAYGTPRAMTHLRSMLVAAGLLPTVDTVLLDFERFLRQRLAALARHPHERLLRLYGLWHQLPRMRAKAASGPLAYGAFVYALQQFVAAESFLTWLSDRGHQPNRLTQPDLDAWFVTSRRSERERIRGFLRWAMTSRRLPRLTVAVVPPQQRQPISQQQRLDLINRLATDETTALSSRVAGLLVLLYAQPLTRVRILTLDDIQGKDQFTCIGLGEPPSPVPQPFADLLLRLVRERDHLNTATNAASRWLFPGFSPGQPIAYMSMRRKLNTAGIAPSLTRVSALRHLVLEVPAPVVATALGFHQTTTQRQNRNAAGVWNRYAAARTSPKPTS